MKAIAKFFLVLICSTVSMAQIERNNWDPVLMPQGYPVQSPILSNVSDIGFYNPSFLSRFNGTSAGISYQYGFRIENTYFGFHGQSLVNGLPYSAVLSYQTGNLHLAASINQTYNLQLETHFETGMVDIAGSIAVQHNLSMNRDIHEYSLLSSYQIGSLPNRNSLSLGLRLSLGKLYYQDSWVPAQIYSPDKEASIYSMAFAIGADYKYTFEEGTLNIGGYFEKGQNFRKDIEIKLNNQVNQNGQVYYPLSPLYTIEVTTPDALRLDFSLDLPKVLIAVNLSEIFWNGASDRFRNNLNFSIGASYRTSEWLSLSAGALLNNRKYVSDPDNFLPDFSGQFFMLGADVILGNYKLGFSVSDSHLFSAESRKQTIGRLSAEYKF